MTVPASELKRETGSMFVSNRISEKVIKELKASGIKFERREDVQFIDELAAHLVFTNYIDRWAAWQIEDTIERQDMELSAHAACA